ncbi:MAG: hypothetical protein K0R55_2635 [Sporomusa sp.]|nr:hypothetical protein [Sporomusa sp.]
MSDPYARNMFGSFNPYYAKQPVIGRLVVVLDGVYENRGLELIKPPSRALRQTEIHELIVTDEEAQPGSKVNNIAYVGFFEINQGGVIIIGDEVKIGKQLIGKIAGYDETHMPNHLNIIITGSKTTGKEFALSVSDEVIIG